MPNTSNYVEMQPSANAHLIQDAPDGYDQNYQMTEQEYAAAL